MGRAKYLDRQKVKEYLFTESHLNIHDLDTLIEQLLELKEKLDSPKYEETEASFNIDISCSECGEDCRCPRSDSDYTPYYDICFGSPEGKLVALCYGIREETDEEYNKRVTAERARRKKRRDGEKKRKQDAEAYQREMYEKLKKKFEQE